jgi:hypothetical protein
MDGTFHGTRRDLRLTTARQPWLRHRERYELPEVRLVGGPRDGEWERVQPGEQIRVTLWTDGSTRPSGHATYAPSEDDPRSYVFSGLHEYDWEQRAVPPGAPTARVYRLAMEFGVDSKSVMTKL